MPICLFVSTWPIWQHLWMFHILILVLWGLFMWQNKSMSCIPTYSWTPWETPPASWSTVVPGADGCKGPWGCCPLSERGTGFPVHPCPSTGTCGSPPPEELPGCWRPLFQGFARGDRRKGRVWAQRLGLRPVPRSASTWACWSQFNSCAT